MRIVCVLGLLALSLAGEARLAWAQDAGGAASIYTDPSPRSRALGGAGVALPGDDPFLSYYNPAHLADAEGISWGHSRTRLVPDLAEDVSFHGDYLVLGAAGLGLAFDGRPVHPWGGTLLDYGKSIVTISNPGADSIVSFNPFERVREFGIGGHVYQTLRRLASLAGVSLPRIDDYADVSFGYRWKTYLIDSGPASVLQFAGISPAAGDIVTEGSARDWGLLLRVTPYHDIAGDYFRGEEQSGKPLQSLGGLSVDLYAGYSVLNHGADTVSFGGGSDRHPVDELRRRGLGLAVRTGMPAFLREDEVGDTPGLARFLGPAFDLNATYERIQNHTYPSSSDMTAWGTEVTFFGVLSGRIGHHGDPVYGIEGLTGGFGLNLHYADAVALRYDWATWPQAAPLVHVHPWGWRFNLNPYGLLKVLLGG